MAFELGQFYIGDQILGLFRQRSFVRSPFRDYDRMPEFTGIYWSNISAIMIFFILAESLWAVSYADP
jgi:hypothetical protein